MSWRAANQDKTRSSTPWNHCSPLAKACSISPTSLLSDMRIWPFIRYVVSALVLFPSTVGGPYEVWRGMYFLVYEQMQTSLLHAAIGLALLVVCKTAYSAVCAWDEAHRQG